MACPVSLPRAGAEAGCVFLSGISVGVGDVVDGQIADVGAGHDRRDVYAGLRAIAPRPNRTGNSNRRHHSNRDGVHAAVTSANLSGLNGHG